MVEFYVRYGGDDFREEGAVVGVFGFFEDCGDREIISLLGCGRGRDYRRLFLFWVYVVRLFIYLLNL